MAKGALRGQPDSLPQNMPRKGPMKNPPKAAPQDQANGMCPPGQTAGSYSGSFNDQQFSSGKMPKMSDNRLRMGK